MEMVVCIHTCTQTHIHIHTHTHTQSPYITADDVTGIESIIESKDNFRGVDILLTSDWPSGVATHTQPPEQLDMTCTGSEAVARLAVTVRPRYHFAGSMHRFYERTPYRYDGRLTVTPLCMDTRGTEGVLRFMTLKL